jgi:uncharacterized protein YndB with AHSA1/START domain
MEFVLETREAVSRVWKAISRHEEMVQWFFEQLPDFRAEQGFSTRFEVVSSGRIFTHCWTLVEVETEHLIRYDWTYEEYPGQAWVTFRLEPFETGTRLTLIYEGLHSFPRSIPEFSEESCIRGWNYFIVERLKHYLGS